MMRAATETHLGESDQQLASYMLKRLTEFGGRDAPNVRVWTSPRSFIGGDILVGARTPSGAQHCLVADFTGHGLAAAIAAVPIAESFLAMTRKGFGMRRILQELNRRTRDLLPRWVFCAAGMVAVDPSGRSAEVFNAGLPGILLAGANGAYRRVPSFHPPLGVLEALTESPRNFSMGEGDRIYAYTDGLVEASNASNEQFGEDRVVAALTGDPSGGLDTVRAAYSSFLGDAEGHDDTAAMEIRCEPAGSVSVPTYNDHDERGGTWKMCFELAYDSIRSSDPVPQIAGVLNEYRGLARHRETITVILTELFANAVDHGLLGLDSGLKKDADGFALYYDEREKRLQALDRGWVRITLENTPLPSGGRLRIHCEDSGDGFSVGAPDGGESALFGRGLKLVRELSAGLRFQTGTSNVVVEYVWS